MKPESTRSRFICCAHQLSAGSFRAKRERAIGGRHSSTRSASMGLLLSIEVVVLLTTGVTSLGAKQPEVVVDGDGDSLADDLETSFLGTSPSNVDSDGDGVPDGEEDHDSDGISNAQEEADVIALIVAAREGDLTEVERLIRRGTELEVYHPVEDSTPLVAAAANGRTNVLRVLLDAGVDVNAATDYRVPPALVAAVQGDSETMHDTVRLLLQSGAEVDAIQENSRTALMCLMSDNADVARELLRAGANPDGYPGNTAHTPLIFAAERGLFEVASVLIEVGADVDRPGYSQWTPLMDAARMGKARVASLLVSAGATVDAVDDDGATALIHCVQVERDRVDATGGVTPRIEILQMLLDAGADVNHVSDAGTPLGIAITHGNKDLIRFLLDAGASDRFDETALFARVLWVGNDLFAWTYSGSILFLRGLGDAPAGNEVTVSELVLSDRTLSSIAALPDGDRLVAVDGDGQLFLVRISGSDLELERSAPLHESFPLSVSYRLEPWQDGVLCLANKRRIYLVDAGLTARGYWDLAWSLHSFNAMEVSDAGLTIQLINGSSTRLTMDQLQPLEGR